MCSRVVVAEKENYNFKRIQYNSSWKGESNHEVYMKKYSDINPQTRKKSLHFIKNAK